jgi:hypothetical protein
MTERHIEQKMINFIDAKLAPNGFAQYALDVRKPRLLFGLAIESCIGIYEVGGNNQGPMVELIQKTIGGAVNEPWCASLIQTGLAYAEVKTGVQSPIYPTEHCRTMWEMTEHTQRVKSMPLKYAIIVWGYEGTNNGHTGCIIESTMQQHFYCAEGNTSGDGSRDGHGVFYKKRDWIRSGKLVKLGCLKPF